MLLNPFKKAAKSEPSREQENQAKKTKPAKKEEVVIKEEIKESVPVLPVMGNAEAYRVLKNFYVSEKASLLNGFNQYIFKVFRSANKSQIRKQVEKLFNVKVESVNVLNIIIKKKDLGR